MTLKEAIAKRDIEFIRKYSKITPVSEIAKLLEQLDDVESVIFFRLLSTDISGEVFSYLSPEVKKNLINNFSDNMISKVLDELYTDEIADLLEEMPVNLTKRILKNTDKETRNDLNRILKYSDDVVGSIMSIDIVTLDEKFSCAKALNKIRENRDEAELVRYYYVVDKKNYLKGTVTLENLVFSDPKVKIAKLITPVPFIRTHDKKETAALVFAENDLDVLPVINTSKIVVGMVTADDIIDVLQEEATEDMYKMAGISSKKHETSYLKTPIRDLVNSRVIWLLILMIGSTLSQIVIDKFTGAIDGLDILKTRGLAIFVGTIVSIIPVIAGSAGNAGSQAATTITRAISLGEIERNSLLKKVLMKEFLIGLIIGAILMVANFVRLILYFLATKELLDNRPLNEVNQATQIVHSTMPYWNGILIISAAASFAMMLVIVFSKFLGSLIPLIASRLGKDPAVMSAPILATLTDATSTFIFFGITISIFMLIPF
ncbi:magnesium transporter [Candidatus Mycoplasma pogonae]